MIALPDGRGLNALQIRSDSASRLRSKNAVMLSGVLRASGPPGAGCAPSKTQSKHLQKRFSSDVGWSDAALAVEPKRGSKLLKTKALCVLAIGKRKRVSSVRGRGQTASGDVSTPSSARGTRLDCAQHDSGFSNASACKRASRGGPSMKSIQSMDSIPHERSSHARTNGVFRSRVFIPFPERNRKKSEDSAKRSCRSCAGC